jgi:hypothetical protein
MQLVFPLDRWEITRTRYIPIRDVSSPARYQIKPDPIYDPVCDLLRQYKSQGYPFALLNLLHAAGEKMLAPIGKKISRKRSLFASGGLFLALNARHENLALRQQFGDFTSGFSHQFGVALTIMTMSEAFKISWDKLTPIRVGRAKSLDYQANIPDGLLYVEAKGVTSEDSKNNARSSIYKKKVEARKSTSPEPIAMIGVIVQAVHGGRSGNAPGGSSRIPNKALIEIIDPEPPEHVARLSEADEKAILYRHYAGAALFAGLPFIAEEFLLRANALQAGQSRLINPFQNFHINKNSIFTAFSRNLIGVQWRPGDTSNSQEDAWFYQAMDYDILHDILTQENFPLTKWYHYYESSSYEDHIENLLPDGSYFGIGTKSMNGLLTVEQGETDIWRLHYR